MRDLEHTRRGLESWISRQVGIHGVVVTDLSSPKAGFSNETILGHARWTDGDGLAHDRSFVVRVEPTDHSLFIAPDAFFQFRVMEELGRHPQIPVPRVLCSEADPSILGAPFFLMDRVDGRVPIDVPSWHARGWTTELTPAERGRLYDNGLAGMAAVHALDWRDGFEFLPYQGAASPLEGYLAHIERWYEWCAPSRRYDGQIIDAAMAYVTGHRPLAPTTSVVWGDARVGNILFDDRLEVAALLDWEGAVLGPPEIDVGWWLMFEDYLSVSQGIPRLVGVPDRRQTIERYEELVGRQLVDIRYYEVLAGLVFSLINSRLVELLIADGQVDVSVASEYVTRVTGLTQRLLEDAS